VVEVDRASERASVQCLIVSRYVARQQAQYAEGATERSCRRPHAFFSCQGWHRLSIRRGILRNFGIIQHRSLIDRPLS